MQVNGVEALKVSFETETATRKCMIAIGSLIHFSAAAALGIVFCYWYANVSKIQSSWEDMWDEIVARDGFQDFIDRYEAQNGVNFDDFLKQNKYDNEYITYNIWHADESEWTDAGEAQALQDEIRASCD